MKVTLTAAVAFSVGLLAAGCGSGGVIATPPHRGPATQETSQRVSLVCPSRAPRQTTLDVYARLAHPGATRLELCRYSGANAPRPLKLSRSRLIGNEALIDRLTRELNTLPQRRVIYHCPMDDGSEIVLVFGYGHLRPERVIVGLTGCHMVTNGRSGILAVSPAGARLIQQLTALINPDQKSLLIRHVADTTKFRAEGVSLTAAPSGYRPTVSRSAVLALLRQSDFRSFSQGMPTVRLATVMDGRPARGAYPAWVIIFHHTRPTSYGLAPAQGKPNCAFVDIYDLRSRVWAWHFQNCPQPPTFHRAAPSCDFGCTPANQPALDADASHAARMAGRSYYSGAVIDTSANKVTIYLASAPQSVINELQSAHPGIYVIHDDAPRPRSAVTKLQNSLDWKALQSQGVDIVSTGPTEDGYLQVGVTSDVASAQAKLDAIYGPNIIRVYKGQIFNGAPYGPTPNRASAGTLAIRSTRSRGPTPPEVRQWQKGKPRAVASGDSIRFLLLGSGCRPRMISARIEGQTLTLLRRPEDGCTLEARFYEVTVSFSKPITTDHVTTVVIKYRGVGRGQRMPLVILRSG